MVLYHSIFDFTSQAPSMETMETNVSMSIPPRKRRLSREKIEEHPLYQKFSHIKTKRVKELGFMSHLIPDLEQRIIQLKRKKTSQLSWEDITQALKDDTLDQVRDNRTLKQDIEKNNLICEYLQKWFAHIHPTAMSPNYVVENWRHSTLFHGNESSRHVGLKWISKHAYLNTDRIMSTIRFPSSDENYMDINSICIDNIVITQVATQCILPYPLEDVAEAYWHAEKSFGEFLFRSKFIHPRLMASIHGDIDYTHEEVGNDMQRVSDKVIMGRFAEDNRAVCVLRSVMNDELYPLEPNTWSTDTRQWMVAERLGPKKTLVRHYYSIDHPCTDAGYVSIWQYARMCGVHGIDDADVTEKLQLHLQTKHLNSRKNFSTHFHQTLQALYDRDEGKT